MAALLFAEPLFAGDLPSPISTENFHSADMEKAKIGQLLFYDKILSGNRNIACVTCHHPEFGSSDGLSLGIGEGGNGIGPDRTAGEGADRILKRIPRNAQALWNLGAKEVGIMFHDGRLSSDNVYGNGFNSPAEEWLPNGLDSILSAQAIFPLTSMAEMAGSKGENEIAGAVNDRIDLGWPIIAKRVRIIPEYGELFVSAFDNIDKPEDVTIVELANALGAFMNIEFQSFDSPFDSYLAGNSTALSKVQLQGMELFFGKANCSSCHSGPFLSDHRFYALSLPPFGPGRTRNFDPYVRDVGRMSESDILEDAYRFRTPMLRNVALTAPYGHNGAYPSLRSMVEHHLQPTFMLENWDPSDANLPSAPWLEQTDFLVLSDKLEIARQRRALDIVPISLSKDEVSSIVAFLGSLTGTQSVRSPIFGSPSEVPSGLVEN